jgi:transposase
VALESTGVYWQPLRNLPEDRFTLLLVNAQHGHQVPGRKADVRDCEWPADLLRHGLLRASFVPARPPRELRELVRYRTSLVRERGGRSPACRRRWEGPPPSSARWLPTSSGAPAGPS